MGNQRRVHGEQAEATVEALAVLPDPFKSMAMTMVDICAYAGTGNVLKIQSLLHICSEHFEPEKEAATDKKDKKNAKTTPKADEKTTEAEKKAEKEKAEKAAESSPDMS